MKLFQYYDTDDCVRVGVLDNGKHIAMPQDVTIDDLLGKTEAQWRKQMESWKCRDMKSMEIRFAPIVSHPEKILCVGLNYDEHIVEAGETKPGFPTVFCKFPNALLGSGEVLHLPAKAKKFDYEAELVIVMGAVCKGVSPEEASSYIAGYTTGNDFSARDLQKATSQWTMGKTCDGFAPVGPYLVSADSVDPNHLDISCKVNGKYVQQANTEKMIYSCDEIVSYLSQFIQLRKGDLIFTGTPSGVILGKLEGEQKWLKSGDTVTIEIQDIGTLKTKLE